MLLRYPIVIAFTSLVTPACKSESPREMLIGTWKLKNTGDSMIGIATFFKTNNLLLRTIINGKITDTTNCSYELSADNKLLTTKIGTATFRFEVTKLTKDLLELKAVGKMNVTRYIRFEN